MKKNILEELAHVTQYFSPRIISEVNDTYVKLAKIKGDDIPLHNHQNEDEFFYILSGELLFEEEGKEPFNLEEGDFYVVRKGVNHKVSANEECHIMLIENKTTQHTGEVESHITKSVEDQLKG